MINFKDKIVVDYGIGGGHIGKFLLQHRGIKQYIGIDIAQRSLDRAATVLKECKKFHLFLTPVDFSKFHADVFLSTACMQHFPNQEYLDNFLARLNCSGIKVLALQFRYNPKTIFKPSYNGNIYPCPDFACVTNIKYLSSLLPNYKIRYESDCNNPAKYQYTIWDMIA